MQRLIDFYISRNGSSPSNHTEPNGVFERFCDAVQYLSPHILYKIGDWSFMLTDRRLPIAINTKSIFQVIEIDNGWCFCPSMRMMLRHYDLKNRDIIERVTVGADFISFRIRGDYQDMMVQNMDGYTNFKNVHTVCIELA